MVRVFAEVLPKSLGQAMYRTNREMRKAAPPGVIFVKDPQDADLQILDVINMEGIAYLYKPDHYVMIQYCMPHPKEWLPLFRNARLVMSYYDLYAMTEADDFPFYRAPLGVDGNVFVATPMPRTYMCMTSGYDPGGEAIGECYDAAVRLGHKVVHLGPDLGYGNGFVSMNDISDNVLATLYSQSKYVSGLRFGEGFEMVMLEGLACGARPITFDLPCFRHWFDGHAIFVPYCWGEELTAILTDIFKQEPVPVSPEERAAVLDKFNWTTIFTEFWRRVLS